MFQPLQNSSCNLCPLHKNVNTICVTDRPIDPKYLLIGEGPGASEDIEGLPFVGKAGRLLDEALINAGLNRSNFYIRNTVSCRPPNNRAPTEQEITICSATYLIPDFISLKPELVVLLGNTALHSFTTRLDGITRNRGFISWPDHLFIIEEDPDPFIPKVFASVHPAAALRSSLVREDFFDDFVNLGHYINSKSQSLDTGKDQVYNQ